MNEDANFSEQAGGTAASRSLPKHPITDSLAKPLAKRFYKDVRVKERAGFEVTLDGLGIKTPGKRPLILPTRKLAEAVSAEWSVQSDVVNPATMPLTRLANTAIDAVATSLADVAADIVAYSGSDLVCYRAETPCDLRQRQNELWDPVLAWAQDVLGAHFKIAEGIMPIVQSKEALDAVASALVPHEPFRLTALHVLTTLTGSTLLALAHTRGFLSADHAWAAAHADEDYQIALWGEDAEAASRRRYRRAEFDSASFLAASLNRI